jgi:hypothetical protein
MSANDGTPPPLRNADGELLLLRTRNPMRHFDEHIRFVDHSGHATGEECTDQCHAYFVDGRRVKGSTTGYLESHTQKFDAPVVSSRIVGSKRWRDDPSYEYYGMSAEAIQQAWRENGRKAADAGSHMHEGIELFLNDALPADDARRSTPEFAQFLAFHARMLRRGYEPYRTELRMYDAAVSRLCGSADIIYRRRRDGALILGDWKRPRDLTFEDRYGHRRCKWPMHELESCDGSKYIAQLNMYRRYIECNAGGTDAPPPRIAKMFLACFHPNQTTYAVHRVPSMRAMADALREKRRVEQDALEEVARGGATEAEPPAKRQRNE